MSFMGNAGSAHSGDTFFINTRFILITSVFIGSMIEPLINHHEQMRALYLWIFTFHMPLFVFVTGYFARQSLSGESGKRMLMLIGAQYLIFQTIYSVLDMFVFKVPDTQHSFFIPYLLCWFLIGHIIWRLIMLLFQALNVRHPVLVSIGIAVLIGYGSFDGAFLNVTRALVFMPFFAIGYTFNYQKFVVLLTSWRRILAGAVSVGLLAVLLLYASDINPRWLVGSLNYSQMDHHEWYAGAYRFALYGLQMIASVGLLAWLPRRQVFITEWGKRTLYVFLLHGFLVRLAVMSGIYHVIRHPLEIAGLLLVTVAATILLAQPFVKQWTHYLIEPNVDWLLRLEYKGKAVSKAK